MKRTRARAWAAYAAAGLVATAVLAGAVILLLGRERALAVGFAAALAYGLQLAAFALLLALRPHAQLFTVAWLGGMILRFGALGACAFWLSRTGALPLATTLLAFVGFVFVLLLLEPVFMRWDLRGT